MLEKLVQALLDAKVRAAQDTLTILAVYTNESTLAFDALSVESDKCLAAVKIQAAKTTKRPTSLTTKRLLFATTGSSSTVQP
jgi:hypothetical protein